MQSCQHCKLHIHHLKYQAQQLLQSQTHLSSLNDTLTSALNGQTSLQDGQQWKAKYEEIRRLNIELQRKCKAVRQRDARRKQNEGSSTRSTRKLEKRSQSLRKMEAFLKKVGKRVNPNYEQNRFSRLRL